MCRTYARSRDLHLVNHKFNEKNLPKECRQQKRRKVSLKFSSGKISRLEAEKKQRRKHRERQRANAHKEKILLEIWLGKERRRQNIQRYKRRKKTLSTISAAQRQVNIQKVIARKAREQLRREMRSFKKLIYFIMRIAHGNSYVFVLLFYNTVCKYSTSNHQEVKA